MSKKLSLTMLAIILLSNYLLAQQMGSYTDNFHYTGPGTAKANSFTNWFWEIYPRPWDTVPPSYAAPSGTTTVTADKWVNFIFNKPTNDTTHPYCAVLTVKKNGPLIKSVRRYQDAEIFNNACVPNRGTGGDEQPPCNTPFPNYRLNTVQAPYSMTNSTADTGALYSNSFNYTDLNNPYYPGKKMANGKRTAYSLKTRVKTEGCTFGTRGWGFWNTHMPNRSNNPSDYFAWFYEFGINFGLSADTNTSTLPAVFPTVLTLNDTDIQVTILIKANFEFVDFYTWNDYEIILSDSLVEYFANGVLLARHTCPPPADSTGGMAYHNWVDNRLYCKDTVINGHTTTHLPVRLPKDKSNYVSYFEAKPVPNYKPSKQTPVYPTKTCHIKRGQGIEAITPMLKNDYVRLMKEKKK